MALGFEVYNTLTRRLEPLRTATEDGRPLVRMYVCGITPYDSGHMGHAFTFAVFDALVRALEAAGARVRYVQNVTDVDDPLFERARRDRIDWQQLAEREHDSFVGDMTRLGWRAPDVMPKVSQEIESIRDAVIGLATAGHAYQSDALYFDSTTYPGYGELSHRSRRSMLRKLRDEGLIGQVGPGHKRDALDFPLWRSSAPDEPAWPSQFGPGRPGWHIECSAMVMRYLGPQIEIHGGGRDLVFSHHESERAQSESLTACVPFSQSWMHTGMVRFGGRKMSKSLGNLVDVGQTLERASPAAVRLYLLSHRYRRDWSFSWSGLDSAERLVARLRRAQAKAGRLGAGAGPTPVATDRGWAGEPSAGDPELRGDFKAALQADLDTPAAIGVLRRALARRDHDSAAWMLSILAGTAALD